MKKQDKQELIEDYIKAYNAFDIEKMVSLMHQDLVFHNYLKGELNLSTNGITEFRQVAEGAKHIFSNRCQKVTAYTFDDDETTIDIDYEGVLAIDIPSGPKAGETLKVKGRSVFRFGDDLIVALSDYS